MHHFIKIIFLSTIFLFCNSPSTHAQMVQLSDSGAYKLTESMNDIAQRYKSNFKIENFDHLGSLDNSPYDIYLATTGPYGHTAIINFYCNKAGYVSKITIMSSASDSTASKASSNAVNLLLGALGISKSEHDVLTGNQLAKNFHSDVWCSKSDRRIVLELLPNKDQNLLYVRLTAYDN